jgi:hypothetical protein
MEKIWEQMNLAVERQATRIWIVNVGDLKPLERNTEFFLTMGYNASTFNPSNLRSAFLSKWATREFGVTGETAEKIVDIVGKYTRWNALRKHELWNTTTFSFINYREADTWISNWSKLSEESQKLQDSLPAETRPAYFQLVNHAVQASSNLARMYYAAGLSNVRATQAAQIANKWAYEAIDLFQNDYAIEEQYHTQLDGKWNHIMDQTHIGYLYWQQPMTNALSPLSFVQNKKQALAGYLRYTTEGTLGAWPGDNVNQGCPETWRCPPPVLPPLDPYVPAGNRYIDISSGGPATFNWSISANQPWVKFSVSSGVISPQNLETRVFVSVDWTVATAASQSATITIQGTSARQAPMTVLAMLTAFNTRPPADFKGTVLSEPDAQSHGCVVGFVEGDGLIAIEAAHTSSNTPANGVTWTEIPGLGRTLSAVTPLPAVGNGDNRFSVGSGPKLCVKILSGSKDIAS